LPPGTYRVRVEGKGFDAQERQGVVLNANHIVTVDVQLAVGVSTTQVQVEGTVPIITTETATTSFVKTETQLLDTAVQVRQGNSNQGFVIYNRASPSTIRGTTPDRGRARSIRIGPMTES